MGPVDCVPQAGRLRRRRCRHQALGLAVSVSARRGLGNTMACRDLDSDNDFSRPRIMLLSRHRLCLIRLLPLMLVCVLGINGCSIGQEFFSPPAEPAPAPEPARAAARAAAELPYYAGRRGLKVYSAPRRGARVLATLPLHQKVLRSEVQYGYARIRTPNGRIEGWVDNGLLIWRLPARPSNTRTAAVKCPPQSAPAASPVESAARAEQTASAEPAAPAGQTGSAETAASPEQEIPVEQTASSESAAPAESSLPSEDTGGLQARPSAEVFDRF